MVDWSKLKAFADDKINVTKMAKFVFDRVENMVGKGENACYQHFSFTRNVFRRLLSWGREKSGFCGKELTHCCVSTNTFEITSERDKMWKPRVCLVSKVFLHLFENTTHSLTFSQTSPGFYVSAVQVL